MKKHLLVFLISIVILLPVSGETKAEETISIKWIPGNTTETYCDIGFRDSATKEVLESENVRLNRIINDYQLLGSIDGLEVYWIVYSNAEDIALRLRMTGPLTNGEAGENESRINWKVSLPDLSEELNSDSSNANNKLSIILDELDPLAESSEAAGTENNNYHSGSEKISITTTENAMEKKLDTYTGGLILEIISA